MDNFHPVITSSLDAAIQLHAAKRVAYLTQNHQALSDAEAIIQKAKEVLSHGKILPCLPRHKCACSN